MERRRSPTWCYRPMPVTPAGASRPRRHRLARSSWGTSCTRRRSRLRVDRWSPIPGRARPTSTQRQLQERALPPTCSASSTSRRPCPSLLLSRPRTGTADLALTKDGPVTANAGEELTFHLKVKNNGPDVATNVLVNDTMPAGLVVVSTDPAAPACQGNVTVVCNLGTLQVGQIGVATIRCALPCSRARCTTTPP